MKIGDLVYHSYDNPPEYGIVVENIKASGYNNHYYVKVFCVEKEETAFQLWTTEYIRVISHEDR